MPFTFEDMIFGRVEANPDDEKAFCEYWNKIHTELSGKIDKTISDINDILSKKESGAISNREAIDQIKSLIGG